MRAALERVDLAAELPTVSLVTPPPRPAAYIHAGHMFAAAESHDLTTILGSCVAVCIWDASSGVGGLNHYLLPEGPARGRMESRIATFAIPQLVADLLSLGAAREGMKAKIVGGACVLRAFQSAPGSTLGTRNIDAARRLLAAEGIAIVLEDVGGQQARKLSFRTGDGTAYIKSL